MQSSKKIDPNQKLYKSNDCHSQRGDKNITFIKNSCKEHWWLFELEIQHLTKSTLKSKLSSICHCKKRGILQLPQPHLHLLCLWSHIFPRNTRTKKKRAFLLPHILHCKCFPSESPQSWQHDEQHWIHSILLSVQMPPFWFSSNKWKSNPNASTLKNGAKTNSIIPMDIYFSTKGKSNHTLSNSLWESITVKRWCKPAKCCSSSSQSLQSGLDVMLHWACSFSPLGVVYCCWCSVHVQWPVKEQDMTGDAVAASLQHYCCMTDHRHAPTAEETTGCCRCDLYDEAVQSSNTTGDNSNTLSPVWGDTLD